MDGRRFDQWTQSLARKLSKNGGTEFEASARRALDQPPRVASTPSVANGTCAPPDPTATAPDRDGQGVASAAAICDWGHPPEVPVVNDDPQLSRTRRPARRQRTQPLSAREQEIAVLIAQGLRDREIAATLVLSEHTVHAHVRNLLAKLSLASRTQIAAWVASRAQADPSSMPREQVEP
jgi:DNA-binding CsgD family transcriptional regulator